MDEETIEKYCQALDLSVSPDNDLRKQAEAFIIEGMETPGFIAAMLHISSNPDLNRDRKIDITQAAAIQFKNIVETHWKYKDDEYAKEMREDGYKVIIIPDETKTYVKDNILTAYINVHSEKVAKQFDFIVRWITKHDFPDKWPDLANKVKEYIESDDLYGSEMFVGLYTLKSIWKRYEYEFDAKREPLNEIADILFPRLEAITTEIEGDNSDQGSRLKNLIGHWFYISNQISLCKRYLDPSMLDFIVKFNTSALEAEIDSSLTQPTESIEEIDHRAESFQWKLKKTAMNFLFRIFQKFSNPQYVNETMKPIAEHWINNYAEGIINLSNALISKAK